MHIYLFRHGAAEPVRPPAPDRERALTGDGERMVRSMTRMVAPLMEPVRVLSSPYRRALETAAIAARELPAEGEILRSPALVPESRPEAVWSEIREQKDAGGLLLVSHEPLISALTAFLLGSGSLDVEFSPATMACVDVVQFRAVPRGTLKWIVPPRLAAL